MTRKAPGLTNTVRIIGGKWRGKKLGFPSIPGLRPTPDRIRETVFNWLQGARVLDLFAGSGAFGFEALSRGAAYTVFVEIDRNAVAQLKTHLRALHIDNAQVEHCAAVQFLLGGLLDADRQPFDIVFLDPPYGQNLLQPCITELENRQFLADNAYIYLEAERALKTLPLPENWRLHRSKHSGQVSYHLAVREPHK